MMPNISRPNFGALLALALASGAGGAEAQLGARDGMPGKRVYDVACTACHGTDGRGAAQARLGFADALPDFSNCSFASREAAQDWETIVARGGPTRRFSRRMPAFRAALSREQIAQVVEYLRSFCSDRRWPLGELNFPRAIGTEKAYPEDEVVLGTSVVTRRGERAVTTTAIYERRWGARTQWEIGVPVVVRERSLAAGGGWTGLELADVGVGLKRTLAHGPRGILSLGSEVKLPVGSSESGAGSGTVRFEGYLAAGLGLVGNSFVQAQAGAELPANSTKAAREAFWRVAVGTTLGASTRPLSPMVEVEGVRELARGAESEWSVIPQVQIALSRRQHVLANVGIRLPVGDVGAPLTRRPRELVAYLLWDWFDGGIFEGW